MPLRLIFFLLLSTVLHAQHTITAEFKSAKLPTEVAFRIELSLVFSLVKQTTQVGGYVSFNNSEPLLKQTSTNLANWSISYDNDGNPIVEGSPQSMAFSFSEPVSEPKDGNCLVYIELVGKLEQIKNGEAIITQKINEPGKILLSSANSKELLYDDASYVFYLYSIEDENKQTTWRYALLKDWQYKDLLEGKYKIREPIRHSGNPFDILLPKGEK